MPAPPRRARRPGTLIPVAAVFAPHQPGRADAPHPRRPPRAANAHRAVRAASAPGWAQGHRREERGWRAASGTAPEPYFSAICTTVLNDFFPPGAVWQSRTKHTGKGLCERNDDNDADKVLSKAPSKHAEEKGRQALSPIGVRAILDITTSNFARQFSPQSQGCPLGASCPWQKNCSKSPSLYIFSAYSCTREPEARGRVRNLPWGVRHCLHSASVCPGGVCVALSLVTGA